MRVLTYASYKEHFQRYTEIRDSISFNSCQIELVKKNQKILAEEFLILYTTGLSPRNKRGAINFTL